VEKRHGKKGFVIITKSFVTIGIEKHFVTTTKCLVLSTKRLVDAAKLLVAATKALFVVPNFVAVPKPFFFRVMKIVYSLANLVIVFSFERFEKV